MDTHEIEGIGYAIAAAVLGLLTILFASRWKPHRHSNLLMLAAALSTLWAAVLAMRGAGYVVLPVILVIVELLRNVAWFIALASVLGLVGKTPLVGRLVPPFVIGVFVVALGPVAYYALGTSDNWVVFPVVAAGYAAAFLNIVLAEQIYRNSTIDARRSLGLLCLAVGGVFAYDALIHMQQIAEMPPGVDWYAARGFVNAMLAVPLGVGIWRTLGAPRDAGSPRQLELYSMALTVFGVVVGVTVAGRIYIRAHGGSWGDVANILFVAAAIIVVSILLMSPSVRARIRVSLKKTFFAYKYDYRKEWLRFIGTLSASAAESVPTTAVRAVAQIVNSPGGVVWAQDEEGAAYLPIGSWRYEIGGDEAVAGDALLIRFLEDWQWIIDSEEMKKYPARYELLRLEDISEAGDDWWLIVPMFLGKRLLGFITLLRPWAVPSLNFEDHDLLRTAGRHVAMHIKQAETDKRLTESSQFSAYNRLTAFLMHDLNNLIAQQSLVVKNAERFRHDQRFVDDAIGTIANCVSRMTRLMDQLRGGGKVPSRHRIELTKALDSAVDRCNSRQPPPRLQLDIDSTLVLADQERLTYVFEHLIRNAQDATPVDGEIRVEATMQDDLVCISIHDTGEGMSAQFIRERLFRPFDSTKGSHAMGIGACQARDYIRSIGGQVSVDSEVGVGTSFSVTLPLYG